MTPTDTQEPVQEPKTEQPATKPEEKTVEVTAGFHPDGTPIVFKIPLAN